MKIKFSDNNEILEIENSKALVDWLRKTSYTEYPDNKKYMLDYARRSVIACNNDIRATSEEEFVSDLIKHKHIILLE